MSRLPRKPFTRTGLPPKRRKVINPATTPAGYAAELMVERLGARVAYYEAGRRAERSTNPMTTAYYHQVQIAIDNLRMKAEASRLARLREIGR